MNRLSVQELSCVRDTASGGQMIAKSTHIIEQVLAVLRNRLPIQAVQGYNVHL